MYNYDKFRIALSKFRLSSHHLAIELGRHLNIPRENRLCPHCNQNMAENEYHFLLTCTKYYKLRKQYLKKKKNIINSQLLINLNP